MLEDYVSRVFVLAYTTINADLRGTSIILSFVDLFPRWRVEDIVVVVINDGFGGIYK